MKEAPLLSHITDGKTKAQSNEVSPQDQQSPNPGLPPHWKLLHPVSKMKITFGPRSPAPLYASAPKANSSQRAASSLFQQAPSLLRPPARAGWTGSQGSTREPSFPPPPGTSALTLPLYLLYGSRDWRAGGGAEQGCPVSPLNALLE